MKLFSPFSLKLNTSTGLLSQFMQNTLVVVFLLSIVIHSKALALTLASTSSSSEISASKLKITTSFSILTALVRELGQEKVEVHSLIAAGREPHDFSPKSSDIVRLKKSQLFIINGLGFEPWADRLVNSSQFTGKTIIASNGFTPLKYFQKLDPHAWQDPRNLKIYANNIVKALIELDIRSKGFYENQNKLFQTKIDQIYNKIVEKTKNRRITILVNHGAFNYFTQAFQFEFIPYFDLGHAEDLSAKRISLLITELKKKAVKYYAIENGTSSESIKHLAESLHLTFLGTLFADTLASDESDIFSLYERNLEVLLKINP